MKKFYDESKFANLLMPGYMAITLGPVAFSKRVFSQVDKNHECTHMRQWAEWMVVATIIISLLIIIFNISGWWMILAPVFYYILYMLEYVIRIPINKGDAYKHLSFEREAYEHENDDNYNTNCDYFGSLKYLFKK